MHSAPGVMEISFETGVPKGNIATNLVSPSAPLNIFPSGQMR